MMEDNTNKTILVTGATGTVGTALCEHLVHKGYRVHGLSRSARQHPQIRFFSWNPKLRFIDKSALKNVAYIIHLAGEGIMDQRWSHQRKQDLIESRVQSAMFLQEVCEQENVQLQAFVSASGVGFYGTDPSKVFIESDRAGADFLAACCVEWERAAFRFSSITRVAVLRLGIVLDQHQGALPKLAAPVKMGFGSALGTGKQAMPWVHIDDVCAAFEYMIASNHSGVYNLVADEEQSNASFTKTLAKVLHRPFVMPKVPSFLLRMILGESSIAILEGQQVSNAKLKAAGFTFRYSVLKEALENIYGQKTA